MADEPFKALYQYGYRRSADQDSDTPVRYPVIIVGAGPIGLAAGIDLAQRGIRVVILDDNDKISEGSRAICFSKRCIEVCDQLGVGQRMVDKGIVWQLGKVFLEDDQVYTFDLLPEPGHKRPAFINLQQYYLEAYLVERAEELDNLEIRWRNEVTELHRLGDGVRASIATPDGPYALEADWLIACDGARSPLRSMMGLEFKGKVFEDRFLIADVKMTADFPNERWFWFDPPFHKGQSTLLHKQPDDVWRIDFQLGGDADPEEEKKPENVIPRLKAMLGEDAKFELEWVSVYTFQCKRMDDFVHDRVLFAGDSAHQVSPFGARGANSGIEDANNLGWKLAAIIAGDAPVSLLESYGQERQCAADDNIGHSTRATDFISPKSGTARVFRNAALNLARTAQFARSMVNSGRLSTPSFYEGSELTTPDEDSWSCQARPGCALVDSPMQDKDGNDVWLSDQIGPGFTLIVDGDSDINDIPDGIDLIVLGKDLTDAVGLFDERYDAAPGAAWLFRPDQYMCARWYQYDADAVAAARDRALGIPS